MTLHQSIIDEIDAVLGDNIDDLHKSALLVTKYTNDLKELEGKLSLADNGEPTEIKKCLHICETYANDLNVHTESVISFENKIEKKLNYYERILDNVNDNLSKVRQLQRILKYFKIMNEIQEISNELKNCVYGKDDLKTLKLYIKLCGDESGTQNLLQKIYDCEAPNLQLYGRSTALFWHNILKEKFTKDFEIVLKAMKWPQFGQSLETFVPSKDNLSKLNTISEHLFTIKIPGDQSLLYVKITPSIICAPISIPVELLLKPFRQRFLYHFTGQRQTNRLDKPEWYFTQILNWAKDNHIFVGKHFQSAALKTGLTELNVRVEFIRGLVQFSIEKLCNEIDDISRNETLFAHLIDEILAFEQELRSMLGYSSSLPSAITVITQAQYLKKWLAIEERFTTEKMDAMLKIGNPWECLDPTNLDELKIPKCADHFIRLLDAIKERYCCLPQPGHQLQFLHLQLELIENFRLRLIQLHKSSVDNVSTVKILNAISYVNSVLKEWGENVHYLHLHAALIGPNADEISSVFDKTIIEIEHWQKKLIKELSLHVVDEVKAKSMRYRHDNWVSMLEQNSKEPFMLSVTAGDMFQLLVKQLHELERELSYNIFMSIIRSIARYLDDFFLDNMIMNTKFSRGGTAQFQHDITRNLFPLFGQYVRKPNQLFKNLSDACILLTLPLGSAILFNETMKTETSLEKIKITLKDVCISNINHIIASEILERRIDICM